MAGEQTDRVTHVRGATVLHRIDDCRARTSLSSRRGWLGVFLKPAFDAVRFPPRAQDVTVRRRDGVTVDDSAKRAAPEGPIAPGTALRAVVMPQAAHAAE